GLVSVTLVLVGTPPEIFELEAHSTDVTKLETHLPVASAANLALELLGRELNLFTEKKEVGKPGDFDHMADAELVEFIEAQGEVVRELERQSTGPPCLI